MLAGKLKGFLKDSVIYGVGDALGRLVSLIMLPILSRAFVPADYGAIDLVSVSYAFLVIAISLNVYPGINRHYFKLEKESQKTLITSCYIFLFLFAIISALLFFIFADTFSGIIINSDELSSSIRILAICLPIELSFNFIQLILRLRRKAVIFTVSNIARIIITPLLVILLVVVLDLGIIGVFISKLIAISILTVSIFFLERDQFGVTISFSVFRNIALFTLPGYPAMIIKQLMEMLPRVILAAFAPLSAVGLFGIAFRVSKVLNLYVKAFQRAWDPFAFSHADKPDEKKIYEIVFKSYSFSLMLIGLFLSLFSKEVITILTPKEYHSAFLLVAGVVFYRGMRGVTQIFGTALYVANKVKFTSYLNLLQLSVFLVLSLLLVPKYHTHGLILSLDIAIVTFFIAYLITIRKTFSFYIPIKKLLLLLITAGILIVLAQSIHVNIFIIILIKSVLMLLFTVFGIRILSTQEERVKIKKMLVSRKS